MCSDVWEHGWVCDRVDSRAGRPGEVAASVQVAS
jgi:hypothetical protein